MIDDPTRIEKLVSATLKLRSALSVALLALAEIEGATSLEEARAKARTARLDARSTLAAGHEDRTGA